jgi:hypothetical protein
LDQDVEDVAVLIHGSPEIVPRATDGQKHLIQVPPVAGAGTPATELIGIHSPEFPAPISHRFVRQDDATGGHHLFDIPVAEAEAEVEPDAMANDF